MGALPAVLRLLRPAGSRGMAGSCGAEPCLLRLLPGSGESGVSALPLETWGILPCRGCVREGARGRARRHCAGSAASGRRGAEPLRRRRVSSAGDEEEQRLPQGHGLQLIAGLCWGESGLEFSAHGGGVQCRMWW